MEKINVYYNAVTHAINIDKGSQITEIKMPANVTATEVTQLYEQIISFYFKYVDDG